MPGLTSCGVASRMMAMSRKPCEGRRHDAVAKHAANVSFAWVGRRRDHPWPVGPQDWNDPAGRYFRREGDAASSAREDVTADMPSSTIAVDGRRLRNEVPAMNRKATQPREARRGGGPPAPCISVIAQERKNSHTDREPSSSVRRSIMKSVGISERTWIARNDLYISPHKHQDIYARNSSRA